MVALILFVILFWGIVIYKSGKWVRKTYISEPEKDKKIGLYKFSEFKESLSNYGIGANPIKANENCLMFRENISNGVEIIGKIDYSINDYIEFNLNEKVHNYYFKIEACIKEVSVTEKSLDYFKRFDIETCKTEISTMRNNVVNNPNYLQVIKLNQLR